MRVAFLTKFSFREVWRLMPITVALRKMKQED